jgi:dnd system-associated protein 4
MSDNPNNADSIPGDHDVRTIVQCAAKAIKVLKKSVSIDEIYDFIVSNDLYHFATDVPKHVLRTCIRRHTVDAGRVDMASDLIFIEENELYALAASGRKKRSPMGMRRIQRAKDKAEIIERLTSESKVDGLVLQPLFKEIWRLLLFSALVGFKAQKREALEPVDQGKGIDQSSFGNSPAWPGILYLMGLVEAEDTAMLASSDEADTNRIQMFEEYANGGLSILREKCGHDEPSLRFLVDYVVSEISSFSAGDPDLKIEI